MDWWRTLRDRPHGTAAELPLPTDRGKAERGLQPQSSSRPFKPGWNWLGGPVIGRVSRYRQPGQRRRAGGPDESRLDHGGQCHRKAVQRNRPTWLPATRYSARRSKARRDIVTSDSAPPARLTTCPGHCAGQQRSIFDTRGAEYRHYRIYLAAASASWPNFVSVAEQFLSEL